MERTAHAVAKRGRAVGAQPGNWTRGERRGRGATGIECTLAVIGTGGPVAWLLAARHVSSSKVTVNDFIVHQGNYERFGKGEDANRTDAIRHPDELPFDGAEIDIRHN
eukprot:5499796-Pyramimonas_sp.AAC.1